MTPAFGNFSLFRMGWQTVSSVLLHRDLCKVPQVSKNLLFYIRISTALPARQEFSLSFPTLPLACMREPQDFAPYTLNLRRHQEFPPAAFLHGLHEEQDSEENAQTQCPEL